MPSYPTQSWHIHHTAGQPFPRKHPAHTYKNKNTSEKVHLPINTALELACNLTNVCMWGEVAVHQGEEVIKLPCM